MMLVIVCIVGLSVLDDQVNVWDKYTVAPDCNGTVPQTEGVCKWSNTTWLSCENTTNYANVHLKSKTVWCEPIELYDVRT